MGLLDIGLLTMGLLGMGLLDIGLLTMGLLAVTFLGTGAWFRSEHDAVHHYFVRRPTRPCYISCFAVIVTPLLMEGIGKIVWRPFILFHFCTKFLPTWFCEATRA